MLIDKMSKKNDNTIKNITHIFLSNKLLRVHIEKVNLNFQQTLYLCDE